MSLCIVCSVDLHDLCVRNDSLCSIKALLLLLFFFFFVVVVETAFIYTETSSGLACSPFHSSLQLGFGIFLYIPLEFKMINIKKTFIHYNIQNMGRLHIMKCDGNEIQTRYGSFILLKSIYMSTLFGSSKN